MRFLRRLFRSRSATGFTQTSEVEIHNSKSANLEVWFEPWGHPFTLAPGQVVRIVAESLTPGSLEVVEEEELTAVYGWSKSSIKAYEGEKLLFDLFELPDLGDHPTPRQVVEMLFGGPGGPR